MSSIRDAKAVAAQALRNVAKSTHLPRPLSGLTDGTVVSWNEMRRTEEAGWAQP